MANRSPIITLTAAPAHSADEALDTPRPISAPKAGSPSLARDLVTLTKPGITRMVLLTAFGGMWLGWRFTGAEVDLPYAAMVMLGTALIVAAANTLNMVLERESDARMTRTKDRPLPAGRMAPGMATTFGVLLALVSMLVLGVSTNVWTIGLAAVAFLSYVFVYTPLKQRTTLALPIGAVPGAIPPLLGWVAVTGSFDAPGLLLFGVLFFWQMPHFLAIAIFRRDEYVRAGIKILPAEAGERVTRHHIVRYLTALVLVSLLLVPYGVGGSMYYPVALASGLGLFAFGAYGLRRGSGPRWAKKFFFGTLIYLCVLFAGLII